MTHAYDAFGNLVASNDPDANAGNTAHQGCSITGSPATYSGCIAYDGTFASLPVPQANALNQKSLTNYQAAATVPQSAVSASGRCRPPTSITRRPR